MDRIATRTQVTMSSGINGRILLRKQDRMIIFTGKISQIRITTMLIIWMNSSSLSWNTTNKVNNNSSSRWFYWINQLWVTRYSVLLLHNFQALIWMLHIILTSRISMAVWTTISPVRIYLHLINPIRCI